MTTRKLVLAALFATAAVPASASVMVIGNSSARACYEAADSPRNPNLQDYRNCDQALRDEPLSREDIVATHVNRGILRFRRGQVDQAIVDFDAAIRLNPDQPEAYFNKGAALLRRENTTEALRLFTIAIERNTARPELAHYGRAIANETLGNTRAAYDDYRRASELRPGWEDPLVELRRFRVVQQP